MTFKFSIDAGWWLAPLAVTLIAFILAYYKSMKTNDCGSSYIPDVFTAGFNLLLYMVALVVTLIAWLIWALMS